ncbi:MBL fold metallo-hydrolase [Effusibacillus dendaii]|uniref:Metallo-beta-lactamase domain-containing protein n=1 Tax=Effusibacillus dendaii TaxID=2743772 RepID=A0A7I8DFH8_9BACL|nr:MBL fold metallo-hydrolase [Effusibacillus dendaii]BCJ87709.1 hypothetical protein skT53_26940 [Effusibacillus dendaii]
MQIDILFEGFPGKSDRGFLGWSSCVLIRIPGERPVLFDTVGFNERFVLLERLAALGVRLDEIESVFLSHFHFDHAVNFGLFPKATFYLHEEEVRHVKENGQKDLAVPYEMFSALENTGRLSILSGSSGETKGIRWVHTPGHTPGLYSIFIQYQAERWVLASDAVKNPAELISGKAAMTWDPQRGEQSIALIRDWADVVVPGHSGAVRIERGPDGIEIRPVTSSTVTISIPQNGIPETKIFVLEA